MKYSFFAVVLMFTTAVHAQDYNLYIRTSQAETGYEVSSIQKITCENGNIVITKKDGTKALSTPAAEISKMYFSTVPVAIRDLKQDTETLDSDVPVFNLQGVRVTSSYKGIVIKNGKKTIQN